MMYECKQHGWSLVKNSGYSCLLSMLNAPYLISNWQSSYQVIQQIQPRERTQHYVQHVSKNTCIRGNHFRYCATSRLQSSGRSVSKAAQCFRNLGVHKPSTLCKKTSNSRRSRTANTSSEKCAKGQHHFLTYTIWLYKYHWNLVVLITLPTCLRENR